MSLDEKRRSKQRQRPVTPPPNGKPRSEPAARLVSRSLAEIESRDIDWLWPGHIPQGMFAMIDGDPSLGKSLITLDIAARLTRGETMPLCDRKAKPAGVLIIAAEDAVEEVIKPRAVAAGCVESMVRVSETIRVGEHERPIRLPEDFDLLEREIIEYRIGLLIVDPFLGFLSQAVDSHKDQSIRDVLHRFKILCEKTHVAGIGLRHLTKNTAGSALYRGLGSIAIVAASRAAYVADNHPTESGVKVFAPTKFNLGPMPKALTYRIGEHMHQPVINWGSECDLTANDLGAKLFPGGDRARDDAAEFLRDMLADGPVAQTEVKEKAEAAGISEKTLKRAKAQVGVRSHKTGFASSTWVWELAPEGGQPIPD